MEPVMFHEIVETRKCRKKKIKLLLMQEKEQVELHLTPSPTLGPIFLVISVLPFVSLKIAGADQSALGFQGPHDKMEINSRIGAK